MRSNAALAVLVLALAGCSSLNPFSAGSDKSKLPELPAIKPTADLRQAWQGTVGASGDYGFSPAVHGKTVFAASHDGSLVRYESGRQVWRVNTGFQLSGGVGTDGQLVVVGTPKGDVLAYDQDGKLRWKARVASEVLAAPVVGESVVIVRTGDARVYAFEAGDGKRRWVYQRATPALTLRNFASAVLVDRSVLAGFPGGKLVAISLTNGAALWEGTVALPRGTTELERVADVTSNPAVNGRVGCAVAYQGKIACFDFNAGTTLWSRDLSSSAGLDMDGRYVYVTDEKGVVQAFDVQNGASVWKQDKLQSRGVTRPLALGARIAVGDSKGLIHLLRREDGAFAARLSTDGSGIVGDLKPTETGFVAQSRSGSLYGLTVE